MKTMKKVVVLLMSISLLMAMAKADYTGITKEALSLRNESGKKIATIPKNEEIRVKKEWSKKRVVVEWKGKTGNVRKKAVKKVVPALTKCNLNQRDEAGNLIQTIPAGRKVYLQEEMSDKERISVKYRKKIGTVLTKELASSFIFIDISDQELSMYLDSVLLCKGPTVTGTATDPERATPTGLFKIRWAEPDKELKGDGYSSFVHYWMPIYGNIGIHDADGWRDEYGGDIYLYNGSHGCINLPGYLAKIVYDNCFKGMPVAVIE